MKYTKGLNNFGDNIRKLRNVFGYNQEEIAKLLCCSRIRYNQIENNKRKLTLEEFLNLKRIYSFKTLDILYKYLSFKTKR